MARAIDADKAIEVAQIKYNDWNLAMAAADGRREINLCFKKQELFKAVKAVLDCVPTLTPPNEWVSVEDRLPEVGQEVLVYWRNTSQKAEHFELTHYDGDHWFLLDNTERPWIVVVAWMHLPAPYDRRPPEGEEDSNV